MMMTTALSKVLSCQQPFLLPVEDETALPEMSSKGRISQEELFSRTMRVRRKPLVKK